ncbi:inositol monophosphatase family protein [Spirulina sp. 06S082]|uniref:inositol monophosphatase family protein n=1 Tax=Spirulina sp. 06S082 TaxID=3110248 RepID=UPI002B1F29F3|nr:inositol monophosphatase family protein [Spirulina sp. 06S082]MEA5469571.1 inositol monophosphatase family protein [Spirulina sp. 06S082]
MAYEKERQTAIAAVTAAAKLCETVRCKKSQPLTKADTSPVTVADFGAQAIICQALGGNFPDDPIIGEEDSAMLQQSDRQEVFSGVVGLVQDILPHATPDDILHWIDRGNGKIAPRYWTLDPIDGTKGFIRGDQYAIALALVENGALKLGILGCPALPVDPADGNSPKGVLFLAVQGEGTQMLSLRDRTAQPANVNGTNDPQTLRLITSVEARHSDRNKQEALMTALGMTSPPYGWTPKPNMPPSPEEKPISIAAFPQRIAKISEKIFGIMQPERSC